MKNCKSIKFIIINQNLKQEITILDELLLTCNMKKEVISLNQNMIEKEYLNEIHMEKVNIEYLILIKKR